MCVVKIRRFSQVWWRTPAVPILERLKQEELGRSGLHSEPLSKKKKRKEGRKKVKFVFFFFVLFAHKAVW